MEDDSENYAIEIEDEDTQKTFDVSISGLNICKYMYNIAPKESF